MPTDEHGPQDAPAALPEDPDRKAIEARRWRLVRLAMVSLGTVAAAGAAASCACLSQACLSIAIDAGPDVPDATTDATDAGPSVCLAPLPPDGGIE